jgi:archaemetzincin
VQREPQLGPTIPQIELVPVGPVERSIFDHLTPELSRRFSATVSIGVPLPLLTHWLDPDRRQYRAGPILDALIERAPEPRVLGIVDADLYVAGLNFIFGQATVGGCCGVIGLVRLRPEFYHAPPEPALFARRTLIEAVHELGHMAGLDHCPDPVCVMHFSRTIEDSDVKGPDFCPRCRTHP